MIQILIIWAKQFFEEDNGKPSAKRLYAFMLVVVFFISYLKTAIPSGQLLDIPENWALLLGGVILGLGALRRISKKGGNGD